VPDGTPYPDEALIGRDDLARIGTSKDFAQLRRFVAPWRETVVRQVAHHAQSDSDLRWRSGYIAGLAYLFDCVDRAISMPDADDRKEGTIDATRDLDDYPGR
jgi:hypothetical protein